MPYTQLFLSHMSHNDCLHLQQALSASVCAVLQLRSRAWQQQSMHCAVVPAVTHELLSGCLLRSLHVQHLVCVWLQPQATGLPHLLVVARQVVLSYFVTAAGIASWMQLLQLRCHSACTAVAPVNSRASSYALCSTARLAACCTHVYLHASIWCIASLDAQS
jgi:hypothetical protein